MYVLNYVTYTNDYLCHRLISESFQLRPKSLLRVMGTLEP